MKIRLISDVHHEFYRGKDWKRQPWSTSAGEDVLVLAGDIASGSSNVLDTIKYFLDTGVPHIVYVPGNHEYYGTSISDFDNKIRNKLKDNVQVSLLNPGCIKKDGVLFVGAPLFTKFSGDPLAEHNAQRLIADFRLIKEAKVSDYTAKYLEQSKYIFDCVKRQGESVHTIVVVTHWLPSHQLISSEYRLDRSGLNSYFANKLDSEMQLVSDRLPNTRLVWMYGHTHKCGNSRINGHWDCIANPAGYPNEYKDHTFNPKLIVHV